MAKPVFKLADDQRSSVTRWGNRIKTLAQKGKPNTLLRRISVRIDAEGKPRQFHPTKGWRRLA